MHVKRIFVWAVTLCLAVCSFAGLRVDCQTARIVDPLSVRAEGEPPELQKLGQTKVLLSGAELVAINQQAALRWPSLAKFGDGAGKKIGAVKRGEFVEWLALCTKLPGRVIENLSHRLCLLSDRARGFPQVADPGTDRGWNFPLECVKGSSYPMKNCRIAVGSTRRPKLNAVKEAASSIAPLLGSGVEFVVEGQDVESGVSHTPASREELMQGARQRVEVLQENLRGRGEAADFYIGLEGGLDVAIEGGVRRAFLESWAYVSDGTKGHFGCSGSIELPETLAEEVLTKGTELSAAIDQFAGAVGIRDGQGAWGVLSRNLISRQESFRLAVVTAFAPFYNARMYKTLAAAGG